MALRVCINNMKREKTKRGFGLIQFTDYNGVECSLQKSSIATDDLIWLGCDDADPQYFVPNGNPSWRKLEVPAETVFNTRMHLTRSQVKKLMPHLQKFIDEGEI